MTMTQTHAYDCDLSMFSNKRPTTYTEIGRNYFLFDIMIWLDNCNWVHAVFALVIPILCSGILSGHRAEDNAWSIDWTNCIIAVLACAVAVRPCNHFKYTPITHCIFYMSMNAHHIIQIYNGHYSFFIQFILHLACEYSSCLVPCHSSTVLHMHV